MEAVQAESRRRRLRACAMVAIAWSCAWALPAFAQNVEDHVDRVTGERRIAYAAERDRDASRPGLSIEIGVVGNEPTANVTLVYVGADNGGGVPAARHGGCHGVAWIADGVPVASGSASHRAEAVDGEMIEMIEQSVDRQWIAQIGAAREVRYRVCRDEYAFTPGDLVAFARIEAKLRPGSRSARPAPSAHAPRPASAQGVDFQGMKWRPKSEDTIF